MKKNIIKTLVTFLLPLIVIVILFKSNILLGLLGLIIYISVSLYLSRAAVFTTIGSSNYSKGNIDKAIEWFDKAYKSGKMSITSVTSYAYILLKTGFIDNSESILTNALKTGTNEDSINQLKSIYALVLWKRKKIDEATQMLEELIKVYSTTSVYGSLGYFLILKGDLEKALAFNLEAFEYNNSDKIIQDNLGQTYLALEQFEKSREIYESLIATNPTFPEAYYNFGQLLEKLNQPEEAIEMYKRALDAKFSFLSTLSKEEIQEKLNTDIK